MSPEKQRPVRAGNPPGGARSVLPAGREAGGQWDIRARDQHALAALGLPTAVDRAREAAAAGATSAARALHSWLNRQPEETARFLACLPNAAQRGLRLRMCGVSFIARLPDGRVVAKARGCKDRLCELCAARRSRCIAARVRAKVLERERVSQRRTRRLRRWETPCWLLTVTQRKVRGESPREALDRLLASWRRFTERHARGLLVGGVRSFEVTSRSEGDKVGRHVVEVGGLHAHIHAVVELREGVTMGDVIDAWLRSADAESWCQEAHRIEPRPGADGQLQERGAAVYQACKYPVETEGLVALAGEAPGYVAKVLRALHGRRTVAAFGAWRGMQLAREDAGELVYGDHAVVTLAMDPSGEVRWTDGQVDLAEDVLLRLMEEGERLARQRGV